MGRGGGVFTGVPGAAGLTGAEGLSADDLAGVLTRSLVGLAGAGFDAMGRTGAAGFAAADWGATGLDGAGFTGFGDRLEALVLGAAGVAAFLTERIALPGAGLIGEAVLAATGLPFFSKLRMRPASSSLIELLWLFAAIESFSAASSTSLFSRPRSLESS